MIYLELFLSFLEVGLFSVGGGYAAMPLIQSQAVEKYAWLSMNEFTDLITIAEMTPGPIAVNSATFVGIRVAGFLGAIVATFACILPSLFIVSLLAYIYYKYKSGNVLGNVLNCLRPTVVALIASAGILIFKNVVFTTGTLAVSDINWIGLVISLIAFFILRKFKTNPILVMSCCGVLNLLIGIIFKGVLV